MTLSNGNGNGNGTGNGTANGIGGDLTFVSRVVTAQEVASVTAVLAATIAEQAASAGSLASRPRSAWERSQRSLQGPPTRGPGAWRSFSG